MNLQEYYIFVNETKRIPETHPIIYPVIGMMGEAGEVSEKVKKWIRNGDGGRRIR